MYIFINLSLAPFIVKVKSRVLVLRKGLESTIVVTDFDEKMVRIWLWELR